MRQKIKEAEDKANEVQGDIKASERVYSENGAAAATDSKPATSFKGGLQNPFGKK